MGELEVRLGLGRLEREGADNDYMSPLARVNLGLRPNLELVSEFEHPTQDSSALWRLAEKHATERRGTHGARPALQAPPAK
jgi:hypothetical protein